MNVVDGAVFFDQEDLAAATDDKLVSAMGAVGLENMPKDWLAANLNHWLELEMGFSSVMRVPTSAAGEDYVFNFVNSLCRSNQSKV